MKRILIVGPLPPPYGGISVYVSRLSAKLREQCVVFNTAGKKSFAGLFRRLKFFLCIDKHTVVHYNSSSWYAAVPFLIWCKIRRGVFVRNTHGFWQVAEKMPGMKKAVVRFIAKKSDKIICVSEKDRQALVSLGAAPEKMHVIPPYLAPDPSELTTGWQAVCLGGNDSAKHSCDAAEVIITANASALNRDRDGADLYGFDMCVRLMRRLHRELPDKRIAFLFFIPGMNRAETESAVFPETGEIPERFHILTGPRTLWPVFTAANLFVRPTTRDGDSISVREALSFGVTCVCSDAAVRPEGVHVFPSRNQEAFNELVISLIRKGNLRKQNSTGTDYFEEILDVLLPCHPERSEGS